MAWSWLRRRADRPSVPAPAATQPPATTLVRPVDDWQELPALQRTLEPLSPVAPLDAFTGGLAAHQNPSFLAALGHRVDPDGPGGLVTGLAAVRAGNPIPYAASTALAVPRPSKPRAAVQRHAISWSTESAAQPAEAPAVDLVDVAPIEETPGPEPGPATATPATGTSEMVTPAPPTAPVATARPTAVPPAASQQAAGPAAATRSASVEPAPTAASAPAPAEFSEPAAEPGSATAASVVVPEPQRTTASDSPVAPLLGAPPDVAETAAEPDGAPESAPAGPPERSTPLPVSRLAADARTAPPTRQPTTTSAQRRGSQRVEPATPRPTISSSTPVPSLQRTLSVVPERTARTSVMPPPFTVELPVVARTVPEPPAPNPPVGGSTDGPTVGALPILSQPDTPTAGPEPALVARVAEDGPPTGPLAAPPPTPELAAPPPTPELAAAPPTPELAAAPPTPEPASADPEPAAGPAETEALDWEPVEPTAPLSGFAARIASLTSPPEHSEPASGTRASALPPVQRQVGPTVSPHGPVRSEPSGPPAAILPTTAGRMPVPQVAPTVGRETPMVQRAAHSATYPSGDPVPAVSNPSTAPGSVWAASETSGPPTAADSPVMPAAAGYGPDLTPATSGPPSAPGAALPVVARLAAGNSPLATPPPRSQPGTVTAALVSHRPPLAVRSDLSSAVPPPAAVQRVSFLGPGQPSTGPRSEASAAVQRTPARIGAPVLSRAVESPVGQHAPRPTVAGEPPVVRTVVAPGRAEHQIEPTPVQRRSVSLLAGPAASPLTTSPAGPGSAFPSAPMPTAGPARSFADMFATRSGGQAAEEAEDHPGYTAVQLQTAAESTAGPPPDEPAAAPAAEPTVQTAGPPAAAASDAAPGAAPTAGAATAQLDEMARRLFEPLSARLRAELWLDRERAGLVTDARH